MNNQDTEPKRPAMPDPSPIMQLATGYWASATMLAANDLGIFSVLSEGELTSAEIADMLGADIRALTILLDGCCGLGLLVKSVANGLYSLSPLSSAFLVPERPGYLGSAIKWSGDQFAAWGRLNETVKTGKPAVAPEDHLGDDPAQTRAFVLGMYERAQGMARGVLGFLDLEGCKSLLDVGGGPGAYAMLLAQKYPGLQAVVRDLPGVTAIAQELIAQHDLSDRVRTEAGDATDGQYGEEVYDAVLFSGVLHQMSQTTIRRMFAGALKALKPGGKIIISDMMLDGSKTQPVFSALFSLQMLLTSKEGEVFSSTECEKWLCLEGFGDTRVINLPAPLPYTVVSAIK